MNDTGRGPIRAPRGTSITARSWLTEAPLRMLMNNLDPEVAERPQDLVVYGGSGKAARNWECFDAIVAALSDRAGAARLARSARERVERDFTPGAMADGWARVYGAVLGRRPRG